MKVVVTCAVCGRAVVMDDAIMVETTEDGSEGYFAHQHCIM